VRDKHNRLVEQPHGVFLYHAQGFLARVLGHRQKQKVAKRLLFGVKKNRLPPIEPQKASLLFGQVCAGP